MATAFWFFNFFFFLFYFSTFCSAADRITLGKILRDGDNITSKEGKFMMGFFSPTGTSKRYLGIWYADLEVQTVVWVANRNKSISDRNGTFKTGTNGNWVVVNGHGDVLWSTNVSVVSENTTASILDSGNLVIFSSKDALRSNKYLWESFEHPTDTFLPGMRVFMENQGKERKVFTSWKNESDPSPGRFSLGVDPRGSPQIVIWDGLDRRWRSGHWNGMEFTGVPNIPTIFFSGFRLNNDDDRLFFTYTASNGSAIRFQITVTGNELQQKWDDEKDQWNSMQSRPSGGCDLYNICGNFARCVFLDKQVCDCVQGFVPRVPEQWNAGNRTGGCVRRMELECRSNSTSDLRNDSEKSDGFMDVERVKLPDFADIVRAQDADECKTKCLNNCSCNAYAFVRGITCLVWSQDLVDLQQFEEGGNTLHVRLHPSEFGKGNRTIIIVVISILVAFALAVMAAIWLVCRHRAKKQEFNQMPKNEVVRSGEFSAEMSGPGDLNAEGHQGNGSELAFFTFSVVATATGNFCTENKLGQGGFGPVYKGSLPCGQEIAVKRLSQRSGQGDGEFKNEITLIANLQHRNLVRLLGCCIEGEEKMLIYEYMPNKSLDSFLFDPARQAQLDWRKRFNIIEGIARGLLYLHRDSRLRIIHRDLKASNILLDEEMNPKISDFGMARIFGGNQNEANTNRVVGTYGYMAPEYAMEGLFSGKSDVYSFGVLLLEIICGRRNTSFRSDEHSGIIGYAWEKWDEGRPMDLVDRSIWDRCQHEEALRCIQLALLCVQDFAVHRPNMSSVVLMLETDNVKLPLPRQPTYTSTRRSVGVEDMWIGNQDLSASNNVTISVLVGR